jgi:hypothetical protein
MTSDIVVKKPLDVSHVSQSSFVSQFFTWYVASDISKLDEVDVGAPPPLHPESAKLAAAIPYPIATNVFNVGILNSSIYGSTQFFVSRRRLGANIGPLGTILIN